MSPPRESFDVFIARAMRSSDPVACLRERRDDPTLDADEGTRLRAIDEDGFRIAALIVAKLRFERLLQGSAPAARGFALDARTFADVFRDYHQQVPMTSPMPWDEGRRFDEWVREQQRTEPQRGQTPSC
ncbi:MAG: hypothetical protein IPH13_03170 [Planctomycetes bacterium]|nr:hypothetical protein [Planctomycetota bacterium]